MPLVLFGFFPRAISPIQPPAVSHSKVRVVDFHFELPDELIAQRPPAERGTSRMLVLGRSGGAGAGAEQPAPIDESFQNLPRLLMPGDLLVLNDSRVLPARLFANRVVAHREPGSPQPTGIIEVLLTEQMEPPHPDPISPPQAVWRTLVKPARRVKVGDSLRFLENPHSGAPQGPEEDLPGSKFSPRRDLLTAEVLAAGGYGERVLRFPRMDDFQGAIARIGHMPLPPYIRRRAIKGPVTDAETAEDRARYQTVYARQLGSAAAPTAGLHFTPEILDALRARGVEIAYVTLHVGLGTFQPVRVSALTDIRLHEERYTVTAEAADAVNRALAEGRRVIAVGTTTTRVLEHMAARAGEGLGVRVEPHSGSTSIFIAPGHRFRVVSGLLTNFHLPESTLLMLVAAFAGAPPVLHEGGDAAQALGPGPGPGPEGELGEERAERGRRRILEAYAHAVREGYRFYSYGDCMLLL